MALFSNVPYRLFRYSARFYSYVQSNVLTFLPADPLRSTNTQSSIVTKSLIKFKKYAHTVDFEPLIKDELSFFFKNQKELNSLQSMKEIGNLLLFIKETESIEGDIIELGIGGGGTTIVMADFLKKINSKRKIFGCDTFEGLPYEDKFSQQSNEKVLGRYNYSINSVSNNIKKFDVDDKITLVKGLFENTLNSKLSDKKFSFVFVDCDLYDATKYCLEFVWPRLSPKGIIVFDEYGGGAQGLKRGVWGESRAVDEFCASKKIKLHLHPEPMIIK